MTKRPALILPAVIAGIVLLAIAVLYPTNATPPASADRPQRR
jgi:hypothetical protein